MLDAQWVVQIYANDTDGDPCIGTGYLIGNSLILTARHVFLFANRAVNPQLKLVFPERDGNGNLKTESNNLIYDLAKAVPFSDDDIEFKGDEQLDVAVIRCPETPLFEPLAKIKLANVNPSLDKDKWQTRGFPRAGKVAGLRREQIGLKGNFQGIKTESIFELLADASLDNTASDNGWGGLSGSPVFVGEQLVAVITDKYKTLNSYFHAVSISYLTRKNEKFRQVVGLDKDDVLNDIIASLCKKIIAEITPILETNKDLLTGLVKELQLDRATKSLAVANYLVEELNIGEAIGGLATVSLGLEPELSANHERWQQYLHDIEQVCGWLLIRSVDDDWWFENEQRHTNQCLVSVLELEERAFVEIIISRNLLQQARFNLDDNGKPVPTNANRIDDTLLFDASPDASYIQLLSVIYKDLRRSRTAPQQLDQLLKEIGQTAQQMYKRRKNKIIYYLVSDDYLKALKASCENFKKLEDQLNGYLQFICCVTDASKQSSACKENQASLLEDVAIILRLKNSKS